MRLRSTLSGARITTPVVPSSRIPLRFTPRAVSTCNLPFSKDLIPDFENSESRSKRSLPRHIMPPSKQQATLGSFFGRPNGAKPAVAQQSKLKFSTKAGSDAVDDNGPQENGHAYEINEDADEDVKMEEDDTGANIAQKRSSPAVEDEEMSEDEPPTKRQKVHTKNGKAASTAVKEEDEEDDVPVKKEPISTGKAARRTEKESKKPAAAKDDESEDQAEESASEHEAESEEEKPAVAAKAREKDQTTLTSKTKDLYPDWKEGDPVPYAALCTTFSKIEMTTKRLEISAHCSLFLRQVLRLTPDDLLPTILLMVNKLAADYTGIELGIGESLIMKAIGETTGRSLPIIKQDQTEIGDLGLVAAKSRSTQPTMFKPKPLTVRGVHKGLMDIAITKGQGAQGSKVAGIKKLLSAADAHIAGKKTIDINTDKGGACESKFIIRSLEGKMRLGLAEKTVLVSLAQAAITHEVLEKTGKPPSTDQLAKAESALKTVYNELPSYEVIIPALLKDGIMNLHESCKLQPGIPLKPMLANPTKSITEVLDRFEGKEFTCEYKYDGERAQIHFVAHDSKQQFLTPVPQAGKTKKGISNIFSRNSEDLSEKYKEILERLPTWLKPDTKSFVLDCEAVGWDSEEKRVLAFQKLMQRKRKDVKVEDIKVKACVFAFDMLFYNGEPLVQKSFRERRELMYSAFNAVEGEFAFAQFGNTNELDQIHDLLEQSVKASCEGLMVKMMDGVESYYQPSRRSQNWLKVKKDYLSGVGDTLDLVVLGAYYGRGKRTSVYGAFLLACYNSQTEKFETVCNIGTGFSDEMLQKLHDQLEPIAIDRPKPFYEHSTGNKDQPAVWFESKYVWEVKTADLTLSPRYRAAAEDMGLTGEGKGVSLRFPRFLQVREDKKPEDATTSKSIAEMYKKQESVSKKTGPSVDDDFEY